MTSCDKVNRSAFVRSVVRHFGKEVTCVRQAYIIDRGARGSECLTCFVCLCCVPLSQSHCVVECYCLLEEEEWERASKIAHMPWINRLIRERNPKKKEEPSWKSLQAGRWRSGVAGGGESQTSGYLRFICEHLCSAARTHAGQKTIFNPALRWPVSTIALLRGCSSSSDEQEPT